MRSSSWAHNDAPDGQEYLAAGRRIGVIGVGLPPSRASQLPHDKVSQIGATTVSLSRIEEHALVEELIGRLARGYVPRRALERKLDHYVRGPCACAFVVTGAHGAGTSTLLAEWVRTRRTAALRVVTRFVGLGDGAISTAELLRSVGEELRDFAPSGVPLPDVGADAEQELAAWRRVLQVASADRRPIVVVIDRIDELDDGDERAEGWWLPAELPQGLRLIVSASEHGADKLQPPPLPGPLRVPPLTRRESKRLVQARFAMRGQALDRKRMRQLLDHDASHNPLWLALVVEETLALGGAYSNKDPLTGLLGPNRGEPVSEALARVFSSALSRLRREAHWHDRLLRRLFGVLGAHPRGMQEIDLLEEIGPADPGTNKEYRSGALIALRALGPYLRPRGGCERAPVAFLYRSLREATAKKYQWQGKSQEASGSLPPSPPAEPSTVEQDAEAAALPESERGGDEHGSDEHRSGPEAGGRHTFQIHLGGIIELLGGHLYSNPGVYIRELLQNAVDAIQLRKALDSTYGGPGRVLIRVLGSDAGGPGVELFDDGVGLDEQETRRFVATIGESSKRGAFGGLEGLDFIGRFGIGLLSCFLVSDEIVIRTRSFRSTDVVDWRGWADGTYTLRSHHDASAAVGTTVRLTAKDGCEGWFTRDRVKELSRRFGGALDCAIELALPSGDRVVLLNSERPPWRRSVDDPDWQQAALRYGERLLGFRAMDCLQLHAEAGRIEGVAYLLDKAPKPTASPAHRVHVRGMLLSDSIDNLLPSWAFFARCVIDAAELHPTASREALCEDELLEKARLQLGNRLREHLLALRTFRPKLLGKIMTTHFAAMKALATVDREFLELMVDWIPFETSFGFMTFGEIRERFDVIRYALTTETYHQLAPIAVARSMGIINAGFTDDRALLQHVSAVFPALSLRPVSATDLIGELDELQPTERKAVVPLLAAASLVLSKLGCGVDARSFEPATLPVLLVLGEDQRKQRTARRIGNEIDPLWSGLLEQLAGEGEIRAQLCFNYNNPLVQQLTRTPDPELRAMAARILYLQALLLGQHPLDAEETSLLSTMLVDLVSWGMREREPEARPEHGPEPEPEPAPEPEPKSP